jgi:hypothetical protein
MGDTRPEYHAAIRQAGRAITAHALGMEFTEISLGQPADGLGNGSPVIEAAGDAAVEIHSQGATAESGASPAAARARDILTQGCP